MHVQVSAAGQPLRLLVDTGASTSAISRAAASALSSVSTQQSVQVRTAAGTISAEVHRVTDVRVGELRLPYLDVLVLEQPPPGADGLLGMDVLARFPGLPGTSRRLGTPAT
jgi:clan AA aspartic protease (TIGR02281 family)